MKRLFSMMFQSRWLSFITFMVGMAIGITMTGVAAAGYSLVDNCVVKPDLQFIFEGADNTPYAGTLPDGHPTGFICSGRTYVPLRWISETLGKQVSWEDSTSTIRVSGAQWNQNGVVMTPTDVLPGPQGTSATVKVRNTGDRNQFVTFDVNFYDGAGNLLGTAKGPDAPVAMAPNQEQTITATSETNLTGYAYLSVVSDVTPEALYQRTTRTGIPAIDRFLDAVMNKDTETLNGLVTMEKQSCTTTPSGSDPRPVCPPGTAAGTVIDVFPAGHCQISYAYGLENAQQAVGRATLSRPLWVYAIYRPGPGDTGYVVVLASSPDDPQAPRIYLNGQGGIVEADTTCNDAATDTPKQADFVLAPKSGN